jgi:hypothetical protein
MIFAKKLILMFVTSSFFGQPVLAARDPKMSFVACVCQYTRTDKDKIEIAELFDRIKDALQALERYYSELVSPRISRARLQDFERYYSELGGLRMPSATLEVEKEYPPSIAKPRTMIDSAVEDKANKLELPFLFVVVTRKILQQNIDDVLTHLSLSRCLLKAWHELDHPYLSTNSLWPNDDLRMKIRIFRYTLFYYLTPLRLRDNLYEIPELPYKMDVRYLAEQNDLLALKGLLLPES